MAAAEGGWLSRHRYLVLSAVTVIGVAIQTANGQWSTDMWQHVAVVRELIARPVDPTHPLVRAATTHPDYSPYTVALGLIGHVTGRGAIAVLSLAAVLNVVLLMGALWLFVIEITDNRRAPFWALLFLLLLWGFEPLRASGVFGLNSIGFGAPYPSAFAAPVALADPDRGAARLSRPPLGVVRRALRRPGPDLDRAPHHRRPGCPPAWWWWPPAGHGAAGPGSG